MQHVRAAGILLRAGVSVRELHKHVLSVQRQVVRLQSATYYALQLVAADSSF